MTKDVLVSVSGLQFGEDNPDRVEIINSGNYYKKNEQHYVIYDELMEGFDQPVRSMLKFKDGALTVTKKGLVNVNMVFEEKKKNKSCYATPYGDILVGIDTNHVTMTEETDRIVVDVDYELEANYEHLASCRIRMEICAKEKGMPLT
jgi:uncharacterized beta-barrel protein YwiB (DUF1934 family)